MPAAFAKGYCQSLVDCCRPLVQSFDESDCEQQVSELFRQDSDSPPDGYDFVPEAAAECVRDWSLLCSGAGPGYDGSRDACSHLYRGHAALGDPCSGGDDDCVEGLECHSDTAGSSTCQKPSIGLAIGADCSGASESCTKTAYCDSDALKCTALGVDGASCDIDYQCQSDYCDQVCKKAPWPASLCAAPYVPK